MNDASLHLRTAAAALRSIGPWVREQLVPSLDERAAEIVGPKIELALTELCGNIVEHGYLGSADGELTVSFTVSPSYVAVMIVDDGVPFEVATNVATATATAAAPGRDADPDANPELDTEETNGYGLFIVRRLTSYFVVERVGNRNRTIVHFDLP
ncbi:MAG: ATP-binding protein [Actinomycetota bacterium]|jgi:anti-sigma regulatory factor (Ser/Thr protein kinase)